MKQQPKKETVNMRVKNALVVVAAIIVGLGTSISLRASDIDDRIESSFKKTYVYQTYLKDEHISIKSKDGVVTLSGSVGDESHKPMAQDVAEALPGVRSVDNRIEIKGEHDATNSDTWLSV